MPPRRTGPTGSFLVARGASSRRRRCATEWGQQKHQQRHGETGDDRGKDEPGAGQSHQGEQDKSASGVLRERVRGAPERPARPAATMTAPAPFPLSGLTMIGVPAVRQRCPGRRARPGPGPRVRTVAGARERVTPGSAGAAPAAPLTGRAAPSYAVHHRHRRPVPPPSPGPGYRSPPTSGCPRPMSPRPRDHLGREVSLGAEQPSADGEVGVVGKPGQPEVDEHGRRPSTMRRRFHVPMQDVDRVHRLQRFREPEGDPDQSSPPTGTGPVHLP